MSGWREVRIGDVCQVGDGAHAKVERQLSGVPYLTSKNFGRGKLKLDDVDFISKQDYERLFAKSAKAIRRPQEGDVLMGIIGTFGNGYRYKSLDKFGVSSSVAILRPDQSKLDPAFLEYVINSETFSSIHQAYSSGSVQGYTNIPTIKSMPIFLPPLDEQRRIATVLSTLDAKIDLLRRQNQTLEQIAQTLFNRWFVEFEFPNDEGQPYKSCGGAMVESELGEIPLDWQVVSLHELGEVNRGKSRHRPRYASHLYNGPYPFIQTGDIKASNGIITEYEQTYSEAGLAQSRLWPTETMCITIAANIAETGILTFPSCFPDSVIGFIADKTKCDVYFIENMFSHLREQIENEATGSVQKNINLETLKRIKFPLPPFTQQKELFPIFRLIGKRIQLNKETIRTLTRLRDTLLPKLMSGQLRVAA